MTDLTIMIKEYILPFAFLVKTSNVCYLLDVIFDDRWWTEKPSIKTLDTRSRIVLRSTRTSRNPLIQCPIAEMAEGNS